MFALIHRSSNWNSKIWWVRSTKRMRRRIQLTNCANRKKKAPFNLDAFEYRICSSALALVCTVFSRPKTFLFFASVDAFEKIFAVHWIELTALRLKFDFPFAPMLAKVSTKINMAAGLLLCALCTVHGADRMSEKALTVNQWTSSI